MFYTYSGVCAFRKWALQVPLEAGMKKFIFFLLFVFCWSCPVHAKGKIQSGLLKVYKGNTIGNLANCKKLKLDGVAFEYYSNGDIKRRSWYDNNKLHGETKYFSEKKELTKIDVFDHDKLVEVQLVKTDDFTP